MWYPHYVVSSMSPMITKNNTDPVPGFNRSCLLVLWGKTWWILHKVGDLTTVFCQFPSRNVYTTKSILVLKIPLASKGLRSQFWIRRKMINFVPWMASSCIIHAKHLLFWLRTNLWTEKTRWNCPVTSLLLCRCFSSRLIFQKLSCSIPTEKTLHFIWCV